MNNSNPLIPQGTLLEQQNKGRARFRIAVLCVFGFHVLLFGGVLMLGCSKETSKTAQDGTSTGGTTGGSTDTAFSSPPPSPSASSNDTASTTSLPPVTSNATPTAPPAPTSLTTTTPTPPPAAPVATAQEYTLASGDTYSSIAKKFHVGVKALEAANPTMPATKLQPGKKIQIPAPTVAATSGTTGSISADMGDLYVVKSGDSLTAIAGKHGTTVKALMAANNLKTTKIKVGDKLKLPAKAASIPTTADTTATASSPTVTSAVPPLSSPTSTLR